MSSDARQSTELSGNGPRHWLQRFICGAALRKARLAAANPPPRKRVEWPASSSCSQRKRFDVVDIVPFRKQRRGKPDFGGTLAGAASHGVRSPCDLREQLLMRVFQADEVVAAVACRPKHHPVAGLAQGFDRLHQQTGWQGRAVAIDEQDAVMSGEQERARRAKQHVRRDHRRPAATVRTLPEAAAA